jgi:GTPase SAR1 family protein
MLGLDSSGKTTALYRLKFDQYLSNTQLMFYRKIYTFIAITDTVPTIGFNCEKVVKKSKVSNNNC